MNILPLSGPLPEDTPCPEWGLRCDISPRFGARLVQESHQLHFLADRRDLQRG